MRIMLCLLLSAMVWAQNDPGKAAASSTIPAPAATLVIPAGTKVPLALQHAVSTKGAREGDSVYAKTTFPIAVNDRVLVPVGTYVQGKISRVERGGHVKGRAEVLIHFTTMVYPSGYTVMLPGALDSLPGAERSSVKDSEGTIQEDSDTGKKAEKTAETAGTGAAIGGISAGSWKGAGIGAGAGAAVGTAIGFFKRGNDVRLEAGTTVEMVIQREVPLDASRIARN
ncbi:MAG TPA: hypothetical protein VLW65_14080 [Bryobacteraceae bacterium]|nr:hypothetical protein [Bryobacteraceae bacterium]